MENIDTEKDKDKKKLDNCYEKISNDKNIINKTDDVLNIIREVHNKLDEFYYYTENTSTNINNNKKNDYYRNLNHSHLSKLEDNFDKYIEYINKDIKNNMEEIDKLESKIKKEKEKENK